MTKQLQCFVVILVGLFSISAQAAKRVLHNDSAPPPADAVNPVPPPTEQAVPAPADAAPPAEVSQPSPPATSPLTIAGPAGNDITFGLLLQPQYQALSSATLNSYSQNLYIRRARVLVGGTMLGMIDYFFDTDYPNLFLSQNVAGPAGGPNIQQKATPGMNIQDAFVTWRGMGDQLKVDVGYMLPPMAHNAIQSAASLYAWDYFSYTFRHTDAFGTSANPVGRDLGVQLRGLVLGGRLEYRAGLFQGLREAQTATDVGARNFFRATGRVQVNLLDPETNGFFYGGTYFGKKRIASVGLAGDIQDDYKYLAVDGIVELPVGPGVATGQINVAHWNGGTFIAALPSQTAFMGEGGFNLTAFGLSPIVRYEHLWIAGAAHQSRYSGGLAYWPYEHNCNLKAFYTLVDVDGDRVVNQFNIQWQIYFY